MENEKKMEESNGSERSKVWYNIYNIVKQIPRKEVNCDAVDAPSAATMIEQLFLNEKMTQKEFNAAARIAEIYFNIAAEAIGEDEVRKKRDLILDGKVSSQEETPNLHSNPDAQVWAKYFMEKKEKNNWSIKDIDEGLMISWFANAMMAIGDHIYQTKTVTEKGDCKVKLNFVELKKEFEKLFMVTDKTEMIGTAINAKLNDVFEWIEQKVKYDYSQLPTNEEIELWAMKTYKEHEDSRWFEPLILAAMWMRDLVVSNSNIPKGAMDINTVKEIIKLCTVLHDSPDSGIEEASGIDLVRMQLEDVLITLKEKKK